MSAIIRNLRSDEASYAAVVAFLISRYFEFPGDSILLAAALVAFFYARDERYRHASEAKRKRYFALGVGYLIFVLFAVLIFAFAPLLPLRLQPPAMQAFIYIDLFYLIPATVYLFLLDKMNEPNKALEPTITSVTDRAAHDPRQP